MGESKMPKNDPSEKKDRAAADAKFDENADHGSDPKSVIAATHDTDEAKATPPPRAQVSREEVRPRK